MDTDILIIGGGLSGLALAAQLTAQGRDFQLLEARPRFGGRVLSAAVGPDHFDLGPAWFWPGQPRMAALVAKLGLTQFEQYAEGALSFEDEHGQVHRGRGFASMQGSYRLEGGLGSLIDGLAGGLAAERLHLNAEVTSLTKTAQGVQLELAAGVSLHARRCVLTLPPRIASELSFAPALPSDALQAMTQTATWMAGQAKAIAVYDRPFWREAGLSGDAMSRFGPMAEIHDASPQNGQSAALFGFIGVPPMARQDEGALRQQIRDQLVRLFGPEAANPIELLVKDWAYDPLTATTLDHAPLYAHPQYGLPRVLIELWDGRLVFAGTEVAPQFGGYLEGALEAAENALEQLAKEKAI